LKSYWQPSSAGFCVQDSRSFERQADSDRGIPGGARSRVPYLRRPEPGLLPRSPSRSNAVCAIRPWHWPPSSARIGTSIVNVPPSTWLPDHGGAILPDSLSFESQNHRQIVFRCGVVNPSLFGQGNGPADEELCCLEIAPQDQDTTQSVQCSIIVRVDKECLEEKAFSQHDQSIFGRAARLDCWSVLQQVRILVVIACQVEYGRFQWPRLFGVNGDPINKLLLLISPTKIAVGQVICYLHFPWTIR
jgi:hypothetical protein